MKEYITVIGLEVHIELKTKSKCFCSCANRFGDEPNTNCCPVCLAMPETIPSLNKEALIGTIKAGLSLGCTINDEAIFERKAYFYADMPKGYQLSQILKPVCLGGGLQTDDGFVGLKQIHLEEDAAKLIHEGNYSLVDFNRTGTPLIEIVTLPDIRGKKQAIEFLTKLRQAIIYSGAAECKMQEGGMRCDVNLSIMEKDAKEFGARVEMKNLNSFKMVERAIEYEENRQKKILLAGGTVAIETRKWDDDLSENFAMRVKETAFQTPDPDIPTVIIDRATVEAIRKTLPLSPSARREKYVNEFKLPEYDANILVLDRKISDLFDETNAICKNPKAVSNFIMSDVMGKLNESEDKEIKISAENLAELITIVEGKKITRAIGKELFGEVWQSGGSIKKIVADRNLTAGIPDGELSLIIDAIIKTNQKATEDYGTKPEKVIQFFVGQVMKETRGKANAEAVATIITNKLGN